MKPWVVLLVLGLAGCEWIEQPGPRLRRDCTSLVDEVLKQDQTVETSALIAEFEKIPGVDPLPPLVFYPSERDYYANADAKKWLDWWLEKQPKPGSSRAKYLADMEAYNASVKARQARLDELTKKYPEVWDRLFRERRDKAIDECIVARAQKEGVVNP